jgi:hypothetical protein
VLFLRLFLVALAQLRGLDHRTRRRHVQTRNTAARGVSILPNRTHSPDAILETLEPAARYRILKTLTAMATA